MGLAPELRTVLSPQCAESNVPDHQEDFFLLKGIQVIFFLFSDCALAERMKMEVTKSLQSIVLGVGKQL